MLDQAIEDQIELKARVEGAPTGERQAEGPVAAAISPSGKKGRARLPIERAANVRQPPSALARETSACFVEVGAGTNALCMSCGKVGSTLNAAALEKNIALRAFCSETSVPKIGASGVRTSPRILPSMSTTEIVTSTRLPSGWRIWARACSATPSAARRICVTSAAVMPLPSRRRKAVHARAVGEDERLDRSGTDCRGRDGCPMAETQRAGRPTARRRRSSPRTAWNSCQRLPGRPRRHWRARHCPMPDCW